MKNKWRILKIVVTVVLFGFLLSFYIKRFNNAKLETINVKLNPTNTEVYFIDEKEIKEILAFYKTSTGKKLIERTPVIQKKWLDDVSANYIPGMADRLEKILTN